MRAAAVQLNCTPDMDRNLAAAERLVRAAAADAADLIVLPERTDLRGGTGTLLQFAQPLDGRPVAWARDLARELRVDLVVGSIAERRDGHDRLANTSVHVGRDGEVEAVYRKIHMFDVDVGDVSYRESAHSEPGDEIVLSLTTLDDVDLGLSICYDLRFPELYRILALRGARVITVPANFTKVTGEAHWEVLLRARAIENQVFVVAPGQCGTQPPDGSSYGNSMIVDPWGTVLARAGDDEECFVAADLDLDEQEKLGVRLPSLAHRVSQAYQWPMADIR